MPAGLPIDKPGKIICVGLNYRDHAEEQGVDLPQRPLVLLVELQLPQDAREPVVGNHWLLRDEKLEPGPQDVQLDVCIET